MEILRVDDSGIYVDEDLANELRARVDVEASSDDPAEAADTPDEGADPPQTPEDQ